MSGGGEDGPEFGAWLRSWRHRARVTQEGLAEDLGYDVSYIRKIESGTRRASRQFRARLSQLVGEPEEALVGVALSDVARPLLPQPVDRLVGREQMAADLVRLLSGPARCVTLTGPPGIGKSRLAAEVAGRLDPTLAAGAWWVPLLDVASPDGVGRQLRRSFGIGDDDSVDPVEAVIVRLRNQDALVVLDNYEHVLEARTVVSRVVSGTRYVTVLVTSREPLGLQSEHLVSVPPLPIPPAGRLSLADAEASPAVQLFVSRAKMVRPDFALDASNCADLVTACARLDGIPLAIVLTAGAVRTLDAAGVVAQLEARADLSHLAPADLPSHQRTLAAAIASSWDGLAPEARALLASVSAFAGGFTLAAATELLAAAPEQVHRTLDELVRKNLVEARPDAAGGPRFELLATIRAFAHDRLEAAGRAADVRRAHAAYFVEWAEDVGRRQTGPDQVRCARIFADEFENLGLAFDWAVVEDPDTAVRLVAALWRFFLMGDIPTGRRWLERALAAARDPTRARATALAAAGALGWVTGHPDEAARDLAAAAELADALDLPDVTALTLVNQGALAEQQDRLDEAEGCLTEALRLYEKLEDRRGRAVALNGLGMMLRRRGRVDEAWPLWTEAAALFRVVGDGMNEAIALGNKAWAAEVGGRLDEAHDISQECRRIQIALGDARGLAATTSALGRLAAARGAVREARALHLEALTGFERLADLPWIGANLVALAALAARDNEPAQAVTLLGAADAVWEQMGVRPRDEDAAVVDEVGGRCRDALGEHAYRRALDAGRFMTTTEVVAFAHR